MAELQIVKLMRREAKSSAELRHLLTMCVTQAQQTFPRVRLLEIDPADLDRDHHGFDPARTTLVIGDTDALVTHQSLEAMRVALSGDCEIVVPSPLQDFPRAEARPVYSLRGFEDLERAILDAAEPPREPPASHLPVALASPRWLQKIPPGRSVGRMLTDPTLLEELSNREDVTHTGVFFELADYYGQRREDILPLLPKSARRVLEVGCGRGLTAEIVGRRLGCPVVGVELNSEIAREAAERMDRVIVGNVLDVEIDGSFDVIIATEVLEHVADTEAFLRRMKKLLAPGGRLIMSVPNVGHYSVVTDLLRGRWDYVPAGLLCVTHARFFTRRSLSEWCERTGFSSYELHPQMTDLPADLDDLARLPETDHDSLRTHGFLVVCTR
jgi:2-polyprenyl-3-methyl-5-hydroxy-6-metoxy-1,4-benzoquinol methylase